MKTKTNVVRLILLLLAVCTVLCAFAGCKKDEPDDTATTEADTTPNVPTELYDENGFLMDEIPDELDYKSNPVTILCWNSENPEFEIKDYGVDVIENAIYDRNTTVEYRLNVSLEFTQINGSVEYCADYKKAVQNAYNAGDYWDIIASYTRSTAICATAGLLKDLGGIENSYIDSDKPWWAQDVVEKTQVGGSYYFTTGDISTNLVQMIYCVWFNADEIEAKGEESPYTLVENNQWTLAKMMEMSKGYYRDINNSGTVNNGDKLTMVANYWDIPALLHGCDVSIVVRDESGAFVMDPQFKGEKAMKILDDVTDWIHLDGGKIDGLKDNFASGEAMFHISQSGAAAKYFTKVDFEYGCVPCPKYTAEQEEYYSTVRQPITLYGIMCNVPNSRLEMITATMECMGSEGYRQTTPVIFDENMKYTHSTSQKMADMLQLIRDTAFFDCGRIYAAEMQICCDWPGNAVRDEVPWSNYVNGSLSTVEKKLKNLSNVLLSLS